MKKFLKSYKSTIILVISIIIGVIVGILFGEDAKVLKPFGDLFLNLLFVVIVPLLFLTITTTIARMKEPKRLSKIMRTIILVFLFTSIVSVMVGFISTYSVDLVDRKDSEMIRESLVIDESSEIDQEELNLLDRTVQLISVNDFQELLSKEHIIAIVVFSILVGFSIRKAKEGGKLALEVLLSFHEIILKLVDLITYYAPIGLLCYMAALVGTFGKSIAIGYLKTFLLYTVVSLAFYFFVYTIYAYLAAGKRGVKAFWRNVIPSTVTSLATCSSAACIPVNIDSAKKIGVSDDIAETVIPLGTSFHKDGSIIGSVFKIMFLVCLFGTDISSMAGVFEVLGVALIANLLITAVPIGGGTISETLIISMLGYPMEALPILTIIATVIDAPATVLNVVGDTSSSMLVARIVDGRDWLKKNE
ncbi:MAG: dicarboxylate/amino acid:cation symporter [Erysipelotrichaceae bacterium]|nr:dicarboxylate/amino acid:cation symporter [Erysipelotrichaceae bacterium]